MKSKSSFVLAVVAAFLLLGGLWFDRVRIQKREAKISTTAAAARVVPALPQRGALLPAGENVEVVGSAKCAFCYWGEGGKSCNTALQTSAEPGIVFLLPNEKRNELENLTGRCAGGNYQITARGTLTQYDGHNYLLVQNFDALKTN
ncbi:MAG: hypothetical protein M3Y86_01120 [Verrucomicrobiota bacterium]|nr:hypothetical protein [Verrucomicrobiota bacterium]